MLLERTNKDIYAVSKIHTNDKIHDKHNQTRMWKFIALNRKSEKNVKRPRTLNVNWMVIGINTIDTQKQKKPWKGKITCVICGSTIDCTHHENWGSFQLNCHLVSLIFSADDRKTRQPWLHVSAKFCFDLWLFIYCRKHVSHVHVSFISTKFKKRIKLFCAKLVVLTCLMRLLIFLRFFPYFASWFHQHTQGLSAATDNISCKHNTPFAKCAFIDFAVG